MQSGRIVAKRKRADSETGTLAGPTYATAMDHKRVLTLDLLVSLTARHRAFVEHARSTWVFDLQRGHDGRYHRHNISSGRSNPQSIVVCFDTRSRGLPVVARKSGGDVLESAQHRLDTLRQFVVLKSLEIFFLKLSWRDRPDDLQVRGVRRWKAD